MLRKERWKDMVREVEAVISERRSSPPGIQARSPWFGIEVQKLMTGDGKGIVQYAARDGNRKSAGRLIKVE
jgi:hypothetical protein